MSLSPSGSEQNAKRRRTGGPDDLSVSIDGSLVQQPGHIPKRGARACTNCRKGKNRCEGEVRIKMPSISLPPRSSSWPASPTGPVTLLLGSLSALPAEWDPMRIRKTRKEDFSHFA